MKKIGQRWLSVVRLFVILLYPLVSLLAPSPVQAAFNPGACNGIAITASPVKDSFKVGEGDITFTISGGLAPNVPYYIGLYLYPNLATQTATVTSNAAGGLPQELKLPIPSDGNGKNYQVLLYRADLTTNNMVCNMGQILVNAAGGINCKIQISHKNSTGQQCYYNGANTNSCLDRAQVLIDATITMGGQPMKNQKVDVSIGDTLGWQQRTTNAQGKIDTAVFENLTANKDYTVEISLDRWGFNNVSCNPVPFQANESCLNAQGQPVCSQNTDPLDSDDGEIVMQEREFKLCTQITNFELKGRCEECYAQEGVWTAVGCIQRTPQSIVKSFLEIGLGVGGGICLLMCLTAGFMLTTSQGDPKQVGEAREMITSAVIGLLFIIFSVFILQFIGVTIFNIPGFGTVTP